VLGWHKERADFSAGVGIYAPTGDFEFGANDNVGLGMWTFELFGGTTVFLDRAKSWNLAAVASWETHGEKEGSDQQVGDIVTLEGGLGKSFAEGAVNVGVAYFGQWKVSSDDFGSELTSDLAALLELDDHRVFGAGPEISFPIVAKQRLIASVSARYLFDFGSRSTTEGDTLYVGFTFPFGGSGS